MKYNVVVNKQYNYIKVYKIIKKVGENENKLSRAVAAFVDNLFSKKAQ